jgi:hypothetical protein
MSQYLPKFRVKSGEQIGNELFFQFPDLQDEQRTYLDADSLASASSLSADGVNFSASQYIVIGQPGNIRTEIVQVSGAPTATTIQLVSPTQFAHNRGDVIRFIPFNQIVPERSTDTNVTYSALSAIGIRADSTETYLQRPSDSSTDYYRYRWFNSTTSLYSAYSDVEIATGYADNSIWSVKNRALEEIGEQLGDLITDRNLNDWLQEARRLADQNPAVFRWSFRTSFNNVTGQMLSGQWRIAVPTNLRDANSYKNVLSIRIGNQNRPVVYQDRTRFNQNYLNVNHTTVKTQASSGATSLALTSTHDFDASGAITIANNNYNDGLISVTYTGNNRATNTLTGIPASGTGSINRTVLVGTDVWQRAVFGLPTAYTPGGDGYWYFDVPLKSDYDGMDVKDDHYNTIPAISTDNQTFDEPFYDLYVSYLKFRIKYKKANGKLDRDGDPDWKDWMSGLANLIGQEVPGQRINFVPDVEGFLSASE